MRHTQGIRLLQASVILLALGGCERGQSPASNAPQASRPSAAGIPPAVVLKDVVETDPRYVIGISYPPGANRHPGLALELKKYADAARADLMQAVEEAGAGKPTGPFDLSLSFSELAATPRLVAIAADGSSYTGGAHGNPLMARFVWLPQQGRRLTATELVPDPRAWNDISSYVREQLHAALSQRVDADQLPPAERAEIVENAGRMIDDGTAPSPDNFAHFEPVLAADGRLDALRFVFPPYQVGPYADGVQTVEVPAEILLPKVAPAYRSLFVGGG